MVALKILNQSLVKERRDIERFMSEAKKVARLHHPNIVSVYDCGQIENSYFISMEFVEGKDLDTIIMEKDPIPIPDILVIAKKLFIALAHSHQNGVIHRDVKPGNIMITYENEVKVVDFGIAALRDDLKTDKRNIIYGTPFYMSPDQYKNSTIDHLSDIYSAGVTLFHLVTGFPPFKGSSRLEIMDKHMNEPVPSIKEYRDDIPEKLIQIIEKCMEKDKKNRYQSASQVIEEIDRIRDDSGNVFITDQTKLKIIEPVDLAPFKLEGDSQTTNLYQKPESLIKAFHDEEVAIEIRKNVLRILEKIGGPLVIEALKKAIRSDNKALLFATFVALKNLGGMELSDVVEFIDKIDIPAFAYHLVLSRYASPELLIDPNHSEVRKAIQEICPEEKGVEILTAVFRVIEDEYSSQNPNPLWHSWITTTQGEKIDQVKEMLKEMICHE